jgi:uncharacterized membrane protein YphA (DoxX/SURF4 family)
MSAAYLVVRFAIALVLVTAAGAKIASFRSFVRGIDAYRLLPRRLLRPAAAAVVGTEAVVGLLLLAGWLDRIAFAVAASLFCVFLVVMALALASGRRVACHCFGASSEPVSRASIARTALLACCSAAASALGGTYGADVTGSDRLAALSIAAGIVFVLRYVHALEPALESFRRQRPTASLPVQRRTLANEPLERAS